jgi:hypothetical protein
MTFAPVGAKCSRALVLRSYGARCFLRIAKAINMLLLRSKSRCVKYVDAVLTVSVFRESSCKPLKTVARSMRNNTGLKPGENEMNDP